MDEYKVINETSVWYLCNSIDCSIWRMWRITMIECDFSPFGQRQLNHQVHGTRILDPVVSVKRSPSVLELLIRCHVLNSCAVFRSIYCFCLWVWALFMRANYYWVLYHDSGFKLYWRAIHVGMRNRSILYVTTSTTPMVNDLLVVPKR